MSFRIYLEIIRAVVVVIVLIILIKKGKLISLKNNIGYKLIIIGYSLLTFASILDITDNFPSLDKYQIIGSTDTQAILEKVVGYLFGFILIGVGFWRWLPSIQALDITRKELKKERNQFFTTLNSIGDGVITTDKDGKIGLINPAAEKITGWSQIEAYGKPIEKVFNIINEDSQEHIETPVARVLKSGEIVSLANHTQLITKKGDHISIADSGAPLKDENGDITGVVLVFRDATKEQEYRNEKLKHTKLESVALLAGGIAHDFNNLLFGIQGNISLALMDETLNGETTELLQDSNKATERAELLTKQLLTLSKATKPQKSIIDVNKIIQETVDFTLSGSGIKCNFMLDDNLWLTEIDTGQFNQVIQNLIINAKQAMNDSGIIRISTSNVSELDAPSLLLNDCKYVYIKIEDDGPGIANENLLKIFDPYFTTKTSGTGLGLAISFSMITKHEGSLRVNSQIGEGATFSIYLPATEKKLEDQILINEKNGTHAKKQRNTIMIMDDEPLIRKLLSSMLKKRDYKVISTRDGEELIEKYKEAKENNIIIDLIMVDLTIPGGMGGVEATKEILKINDKEKIIAVSGYANDDILSNYKDYGFMNSMPKPFTANQLNKLIQKTRK